MTSGAGFKSKPHRDAERMLSRNLQQVPKTYNQDIMPYRVSFHSQYAGGLASVFGVWFGLLLLWVVFPGMALILSVLIGLPALMLPPVWFMRYYRREQVMEGSGVPREDSERLDGEEVHRRALIARGGYEEH